MGRSLKKGPYVVERLLEKVMKADASGSREPIKTWARACTIVPEFVGKHFAIHDGRKFVKLYVTEDMVEHRLGEFAPTRTFRGSRRQGIEGAGRRASQEVSDRAICSISPGQTPNCSPLSSSLTRRRTWLTRFSITRRTVSHGSRCESCARSWT